MLFILLCLPCVLAERCFCSCESVREVGRAGWTVLHTFAETYPDNPQLKDKIAWYGLINAFAHLFPCDYCREHLVANVGKTGWRLDNRTDVSNWICWLHNDVNKENGKPLFPCGAQYK